MNIFRRDRGDKVFYSDLDINFVPNWDKDISTRSNARAVSQSLVNIVTTKKGSMPFDPDYGTSIGSELFKNITPFLLSTIEEEITNTIRKYEPRVGNLNVRMEPSTFNKNTIQITITFSTQYDLHTENTLTFDIEG